MNVLISVNEYAYIGAKLTVFSFMKYHKNVNWFIIRQYWNEIHEETIDFMAYGQSKSVFMRNVNRTQAVFTCL